MKYRVWDKVYNKFRKDVAVTGMGEYLVQYDNVGAYLEGLWEKYTNDINSEIRFEVNLCSGFKDRNGNYIHEKDIINDNFIVFTKEGRFMVKSDDTEGLLKSLINECEVVITGNSYKQGDNK